MNGQKGSILVGYDGSVGARVALDWAAETARRQGKKLLLLHCVDLAMVPAFPAYDPVHIAPSLREVSRSVLDAGVLRATKVLPVEDVSWLHAIGSPAAEIVDSSKDHDLVVMGCRGRGRLLGGLLGSTAYAVTAHAHCPVVIVRSQVREHPDDPIHPGPDRRVVVGVDDSDESVRALDMAAQIADSSGAPLHIVRVAMAVSMEAWAYAETAKAGTSATHELRDNAEETVKRAAAHVRKTYPNLPIETEVLYGDAGHTLAELGARAGLIVVGSRGRGGFSGLLLGSVSHTVIHEATCPVMVVR